jgi:tRNA1Val (adenine37-N6)-methyltransferase
VKSGRPSKISKLDLPVAGRDETLDTFYRGRVHVLQKKKGYRFAVDAPLLADFIQTKPADDVLELGAGNGIIPLLLSFKPFRHITAVEIQDRLADLARRNVRLNKLGDKISVIRRDFREYRPRKKFDVIFSNPPYIKKKTGFLSASAEKSVAKHEIKCDILDVMRKTGELLKAEGRAYFIYPAKRQEELLKAAAICRLTVRALRFVRPRVEDQANVFLAECGFGAGAPRTLRPLILYDERGAYTPEVRRMFEGRRRGPAA